MKFIKSKNFFTGLASVATGLNHSSNNFFYNKFSAEAQQKDNSNKTQKFYDMLKKSTYPSDYVHGILSLHAYEEKNQNDNNKIEFKDAKHEEKYSKMLENWEIAETYFK